MFGPVGGWEVILIFLLALLLFGPRKLPEIGRSFGRTLSQLRRAANEFKTDLESEIRVEETKAVGRDLKSVQRDVANALSDVRRPLAEAPAKSDTPEDDVAGGEAKSGNGDERASVDDR